MQKDNAIERWVEHLNLLAPVQGLIHVGAGASIANTFYAEWLLPQVLLIEADENSAAKLLRATEQRTGWAVSNTLISSNPEACDFYIASNINESGLIAPELLTHLWKNLKAKEVRSLQTTPLSALIRQQISGANWLIIESLTALDVLKSAAEQLNQFDVICVRALRNSLSSDLKESSQEAVHRYLVGYAFTLLQVEEEIQPNVINLLYIRDLKRIHGIKEAQLVARLTENEAQAKLLQAEKEAHQVAEAELNRQLADLKKQLDEKTNWCQKVVVEKEAQAKSESEKAQTLLAEEAHKSAQLLQAEKESHQAVEAELNKKLADLKKLLNEKTNEYQKVVAEKEAQAKAESEKVQALLAEEVNKYSQLLQAEKETHQAVLAELKAKMDNAVSFHEKVMAEKEVQAKSASEKFQASFVEEANKSAQLIKAEKEAHQAAIAELAVIKKERDDQAHWNQKHRDWAESLKREIEALKKDYAEGERAQSLALKLQAKAQVDLEGLRTQYQQKLKQEQNLIELIRELQLKLQAAANYYHQLQLQSPELSAKSKQGNTDNAIDVDIISRPIGSKRAHKKRK
jgi:hypothetical protein